MSGAVPECCAVSATAVAPISCPRCGRTGKKLDEITLRALLKPSALERRSADTHRFCPKPSCAVVYFGSGEIFGREDLIVPVFQKQAGGDSPVCYCFGITAADIGQELVSTGRSTVAARIRSLVQAGRCACEIRNPQGSCCLGNVEVTVHRARRIQAGQGSAPATAGAASVDG